MPRFDSNVSLASLNPRQRMTVAAVIVASLLGFVLLYDRVTETPRWVSDRSPLTSCGRFDYRQPDAGPTLATVKACVLEAQQSLSGGEAVIFQPEGDAVLMTIFRVLPERRAELFERRQTPQESKSKWAQRLCDRLVETEPSFTCG